MRAALTLAGWADAGWHRIDDHDPSADVMTPNMNALVKRGIEMDRHCEYYRRAAIAYVARISLTGVAGCGGSR